jgi:amino acid transporter
VHNAGGALGLGVYVLLMALPAVNRIAGVPVAWHPLRAHAPAVSLFSLNVLGKMGFGAFSGFEYVAIFAGEARGAARSIARSGLVAAPIIVVMFVLGTSGVLAFSAPDDIDLIAPIPQALSRGTRGLPLVQFVVPLAAGAIAFRSLAWGSAAFAGIARLPMVAGWDGLVPGFFTRLHPRWRTPVGSVAFLAGCAFVLGVVGMLGVGEQEAYQLFGNAALIFYALTYLVMFAIPLVRPHATPRRPGLALRVACVSGFAMTLLFIVLSVFPIVRVVSTAAFTVKVAGIVLACNALGFGIWRAARARSPYVPLGGGRS